MTVPSRMKALVLRESGFAPGAVGAAVDSLEPYIEYGTVDVPVPSAGQVLVKVEMASVNPSDIVFVKGLYARPRERGRPAGIEGAGVVVAAGADPAAAALVGKRVAFFAGPGGSGSWAQYALAEAAHCIVIPARLAETDAAAMMVNPLTTLALLAIVRDSGAKALVLAAGSSQIGKLLASAAQEEGIRTVGIVRLHYQIPRLREAGAVQVLNTQAAGYAEALAEMIRKEQPTVLLDAVTGQLASDVFDLMPDESRWIVYGRLDASPTAIREPSQLIFQNKRIEGFFVERWLREPREKRAAIEAEATRRFADGRWSTDVNAIVPMRDAVERVAAEMLKPDGKVFIAP